MGVGVIPDDRLRDGLLLERPVRENFLLGLQRKKPFFHYGLISYLQLEHETLRAIEEYAIRPKSTGIRIGALSGGNQQKLVIAREFRNSPRFIIAAQPTRGVDVGAIEFIHQKIFEARAQGCGVLLISSELDEVLALSDRILVIYEGRIVAEFARGGVTERELGLRMGGAHD
jgi:simple sugar transport system ATP-binding protein